MLNLSHLLEQNRDSGTGVVGEGLAPPVISHAEAGADGVLVQLGTDDAQAAGHLGSAIADVDFAGGVVKVDPTAVRGGDDALRAQDHAESGLVAQLGQDAAQLFFGEGLGRFGAPAGEDIVGMMMVMVVVMSFALMVMMALALGIIAFAVFVMKMLRSPASKAGWMLYP